MRLLVNVFRTHGDGKMFSIVHTIQRVERPTLPRPPARPTAPRAVSSFRFAPPRPGESLPSHRERQGSVVPFLRPRQPQSNPPHILFTRHKPTPLQSV